VEVEVAGASLFSFGDLKNSEGKKKPSLVVRVNWLNPVSVSFQYYLGSIGTIITPHR
jgi:hypothetical protein